MKCPYDCGTELVSAGGHGCRNKLRKQRDEARSHVERLEASLTSYMAKVEALLVERDHEHEYSAHNSNGPWVCWCGKVKP